MLTPQKSNIAAAQQDLSQHRFKAALKHAKKAQRELPRSPLPHNVSGIAHSSLGQPVDAIKSFQRAIKLDPSFVEARKNLAQTYLLIGQHENALLALRSVPGAADVLYIKAQACAALLRKQEALDAATQFIANAPKEKRGYKLRAFIRLQFGLIADALEDYEQASLLDPQDVETLTLMSLPLARHLRTQDALQAVSRAVEIAPDDVPARMRLAAQYSEMGDKARSVEQYQQVLARHPEHAGALKALSEMLSGEALLALGKSVDLALKRAKKGTEDAAFLFFARSRLVAAQGDRVRADQDIALANRYFAKRSPYRPHLEQDFADRVLARFPTPIEPQTEEVSRPRPIFVVGLPRSGTTLVEAILGRHDRVLPLGERGTLGFLLQETISHDLPLGTAEIQELRAEDCRLLPEIPDGIEAYVDKMPENFRFIGFLKRVYPGCTIVHVRRDPRDTALSMFRAHFSGSALNYTYDLQSMAERFNLYARMMAHWHHVLPGQIHDVHYEALVDDIEGEGRKLAEVCNLDWAPQMASPEQTTSQVLTVSANQLRVPVHTRSVGQWEGQKELLAPFLKRLDCELWPNACAEDTKSPD